MTHIETGKKTAAVHQTAHGESTADIRAKALSSAPPPRSAAEEQQIEGQLRALLRRYEGKRLEAYPDPGNGKLTIGYGHQITKDDPPYYRTRGITEKEAEKLLAQDIEIARNSLKNALPWFSELSTQRQAALICMTFQMGIGEAGGKRGVLSFVNALGSLEEKRYKEAAGHFMNSKWGRKYPTRAKEVTGIIETGNLPPDKA